MLPLRAGNRARKLGGDLEKFGIGQPLGRKEDRRLLTGRGRFVDDETPPGAAHAHVLRSPHAHARIRAIDTAGARAMPGVLTVLTGADVAADGLGGLPCLFMPKGPGGGPAGVTPPYPVLARERVRHVGDSVALVVAETAVQARDAAEAIVVDYEALPAVVAMDAAIGPDAPLLHDECPNNICYTYEIGDRDAVDAAFAKAESVVPLDLVNNRVVIAAMETRGAIAIPDAGGGRVALHTTSQMPHPIRADLATVFGEAEDRFRVVVRDVGGGFGAKNSTYPEYILVVWAARRLGRPVKWIGERADAFVTDYHGRANKTRAEMALDKDGRFLAIRVDSLADLGAYASGRGTMSPVVNLPALAGAYTTPAIHVRVRTVFTNTVPTDVYRGAGRPEAVYVLERLVDVAARDIGLDPVEIRRRNIIPPDSYPYKTPLGLTYDSGLYERNLDDGLKRVDWDGFEGRRAEAAARGRLRGLGLANYVERCGAGVTQDAEIRIEPDGVTVLIGTMSNGQGHETAYAQIAAELLGVAYDRVTVVQGDTDLIERGQGTGGSRSIPLGGAAMKLAADKLIDKARRLAAHRMEAAVADIEFIAGRFTIVGTDRALDWVELARAAADPAQIPDGMDPGLDEWGEFVPPNHTFPNGCHLCEVEIDPDTGAMDILRYAVVHDFGRLLNPLMLEGQVHGGVAQGLGQAAFEDTAYDADGQLLAGSFMDYCVPRADDMPAFEFTSNPTECPANPMGFKGCGEAGAAGAPPALINAVVDALRPLGIRHIDMPVTPERLWRAIRNASG